MIAGVKIVLMIIGALSVLGGIAVLVGLFVAARHESWMDETFAHDGDDLADNGRRDHVR